MLSLLHCVAFEQVLLALSSRVPAAKHGQQVA